MSQSDLYLDGEVEGSIEAVKSTVTVGANAKLAASIKARSIIILGSVQGRIQALESLELRRTCELIGDVTTARIVIEEGAYFKGSIDICPQLSQASSPESVALQARYSKLVDLKYVRDLTSPEEAEFESLSAQLSSLDTNLHGRGAQPLAKVPEPPNVLAR